MTIEIENQSATLCDEVALVQVAQFTLGNMGVHPDSDISITLVDEARMTELHIQWMDLPGPTDVLSFPMDEVKPFSASDGPGLIGDIVLCPTVAAQVKTHSMDDELALLTVHGTLHLLGFDHADPDTEKEMFALQDDCLREWRASQ